MTRRAFTLVEVLISVLVLALAVLGLAAVFTATIPQQRVATDQALGLAAAASAKAALLNDRQFADPWNEQQTARQLRGLRWWQTLVNDFSPQGQWELPGPGNNIFRMSVDRLDVDCGRIDILPGPPDNRVFFSLSRRLVPAPYTGASEPQYVWDFVARRVLRDADGNGVIGNGDATPEDPIEVAVFVRRIDPGIRVAPRPRRNGGDRAQLGPRVRLSDMLLRSDEVAASEFAVPVSASTANNLSVEPGVGIATLDGRGDYALPFFVEVAPISTQYRGGRIGSGGPGGPYSGNAIPRDRIPIVGVPSASGPNDLKARMAAQIGQSLVDRNGNVYRVIGIDQHRQDAGVTWLIVDPAVPSDYASPMALRTPGAAGEDLVTTPQPPAAVRVFRVSTP